MSSFYASELQTALEEQIFGIQSFSFASSTPYEAKASVKLLEGDSIIVRLTIQGYTVSNNGTTVSPTALSHYLDWAVHI